MTLLSVSTTLHASMTDASGASEGGGVNVDLDASLVVQFALFVILLVCLKPLLFNPMLKLFEERENRTEKTRRDATREDERSAKALAKYEAAMAKAREAGAAERDVLRAEGTKREVDILARARSMTTATVEQGRAAIAAEAKAARTELATESAALGRVIAGRVLGREVSQ
jgi:F-type H+-transporting ATPase subunit b